ncbi:hypothetical protein D3C75_1309870 [compost metagenome]
MLPQQLLINRRNEALGGSAVQEGRNGGIAVIAQVHGELVYIKINMRFGNLR